MDWTELDGVLVGISASPKGEPGWPPLALFRALRLTTWHDLSDVYLAAALDDRTSFRRFCGSAGHEPTPERTAFVRFRAELVRRRLERAWSRRSRVSSMPGASLCEPALWSYAGGKSEAANRAQGGTPRVVHTGTWGGAEAPARLKAHNPEVRVCEPASRRYSAP